MQSRTAALKCYKDKLEEISFRAITVKLQYINIAF